MSIRYTILPNAPAAVMLLCGRSERAGHMLCRQQRSRWLHYSSQRRSIEANGAALPHCSSISGFRHSACMGQAKVRERQRPHPAMPPPDDVCRCWRGSCWNDTLGRAIMVLAVRVDLGVPLRRSRSARAQGCHARAPGAQPESAPLIRSLQSWHMPRARHQSAGARATVLLTS